MGLMDTVRSGIAVADSLTQDLQVSVMHASVILPASVTGTRTWAAPVSRKALVVRKQQLVKTVSGEMVYSQAYVVFLRPIEIHLLDQITLPDGTKGPILNTEGFVDSGTGRPVLTEVYLG